MLAGKKILLGITGSIAAYKAVFLTRLLIKAGAEVRVIMTESAKQFVSPLTFSTLSKHPVLSDISDGTTWANHVMLGRWADYMLIAPLSCNTLAKMANGQCDNLLLAVYLSATCPVLVAPAMDEDMWKHPSTQKNIHQLAGYGNHVLKVDNGELASGLYGEGRMSEPEEIVLYLEALIGTKKDLDGIKALVTAGPTYEAIDPVRFIGNYSSGKMGIAIAEALNARGALVTLVLGPGELPVDENIQIKRVVSSEQMLDACIEAFEHSTVIILSAAVADYTPVNVSTEKIKKKDGRFDLELKKTTDILKTLGERKRADQILVGFALETNNEKENALKKLKEKNADLIVLNSLKDPGAGFGFNTNKVTIFDNKGGEYRFESKPKTAVATDIINTIIQYKNA